MTSFIPDRRGLLALLIFLAAAALLYIATLDNGLSAGNLEGGDLITHHYAQVQARPSNVPGYPLYTMGGWLWFHGWRLLIPHANPIPILSSYSTLWGLLALAVLFLLLYRLTHRNLVITLSLSAFYAVTYFFWFYSVTTEQYTSVVLQTLVIVALAHAWDEDPRDAYLYALALALGLALAHLITVLFIAPGLLLFFYLKQPSLFRRGRLLARCLLLALLPVLSYAYVYIRGAQHPEWRGAGAWPSAGAWFLNFLSTGQGRSELTWSFGPLTSEFPRLIWVETTPLLLVIGVAGWYLLGRRYALLYGVTAAIYLIFGYIDRFGNWYQVVMPLYPLVVIGASVTLDRLWRQPMTGRSPNRLWRLALSALLVTLVVLKLIDSYPRADQRNRPDDVGLQPGQAILAADPPPHAAILGVAAEKLALDYLTQIWGLRSDLRPIATAEAASTLADGQTLLVTTAAARYLAVETSLPWRFSSWAPGVVMAATTALPPPRRRPHPRGHNAWRQPPAGRLQTRAGSTTRPVGRLGRPRRRPTARTGLGH